MELGPQTIHDKLRCDQRHTVNATNHFDQHFRGLALQNGDNILELCNKFDKEYSEATTSIAFSSSGSWREK